MSFFYLSRHALLSNLLFLGCIVEAGWYWKRDPCGNVSLLILPRSHPHSKAQVPYHPCCEPFCWPLCQDQLPLDTCSDVFLFINNSPSALFQRRILIALPLYECVLSSQPEDILPIFMVFKFVVPHISLCLTEGGVNR